MSPEGGFGGVEVVSVGEGVRVGAGVSVGVSDGAGVSVGVSDGAGGGGGVNVGAGVSVGVGVGVGVGATPAVGVTTADFADHRPLPAEFTALTWNTRPTPFARPLTVTLVALEWVLSDADH